MDRISFLKDRYFASFLTNRPFAASHSRDTKPPYWKAREAVGQGIVYLCECITTVVSFFLFLCKFVEFCDIVTFFWLNFVTVTCVV